VKFVLGLACAFKAHSFCILLAIKRIKTIKDSTKEWPNKSIRSKNDYLFNDKEKLNGPGHWPKLKSLVG